MALYQHSTRSSNFAGPRCKRCHRPLTDPVSVRTGIGPECRTRMGRNSNSEICVRDEFSDITDNSIPFSRAIVLNRQSRPGRTLFEDTLDDGVCVTNVPHLVVQHSPDGFEFGYGGSGPADLALNACQLYLNMTGYTGQQIDCYDGKCWALAYALHQGFKSQFIASAPKAGRIIPFADIDAWFKSEMTPEYVDQFSSESEE